MTGLRVIAVALAACSGDTGMIEVTLATAPGSTLLDSVQTLRMVVTNPRKVVTAERTSRGFDLAFDLPGTGTTAALLVDGLDASGTVIATGASPRFVFGAVDGHVAIYMAAPNSVDIAPVALEPARSALAAGNLVYGAIFAGGTLADGAPSDTVAVYNAYNHTLTAGAPLPAARSGLALGVGTLGVYLFGGHDAAGAAQASLWRFDPGAVPAGMYVEFGDKSGFARAGEQFVARGSEQFLLTGAPAAELRGLDNSMIAHDEIAALPAAGVTVTATDGVVTSVFAGAAGVVRCRGANCELLGLAGRDAASVVALPGGRIGMVCGGSTDTLRIDAATAEVETFPGVPVVAKIGCAATATSRHLVIAGGTNATGIDGLVEVFDLATLEPIAQAALAVPRSGAHAIALPNDQVLIAGGVDAAGAPIATLELFTPASSQ